MARRRTASSNVVQRHKLVYTGKAIITKPTKRYDHPKDKTSIIITKTIARVTLPKLQTQKTNLTGLL